MGLGVHARIEELILLPAPVLGLVKGRIGVLKQGLRVGPILREQAQPDAAGGRVQLVPQHRERHGHGTEGLGRYLGGIMRRGDVGE